MIVECIKSVLHFVEGKKYEAKQIENNCFLFGNRNMFDGNCFNKHFKIIKESKDKILIKSKKYNMGFVEGNIYLCEVHGNEHFSIYNPVINVYTHIVGMDKLKLYFDIIETEQIKLTFDEAVKEIRLDNSKVYTNGFSILKYDEDLNAMVELDKNNNYRDSCAISFKREFYELKKKKSSFEDVVKKYRQGFIIESIESGTKYKHINGECYYFSDLSNKYLPNGELSMEEILGEWYAYEE